MLTSPKSNGTVGDDIQESSKEDSDLPNMSHVGKEKEVDVPGKKDSSIRRSRTRGSIVQEQYFSNRWTHLMHKYVHKPLERWLVKVALHAATHPKKYVAIITTFSLAMIIIGVNTNFHVEDDEAELFTPFDAQVRKHSDWIDDESGFPKFPRPMSFFIHAGGENVLGQEGPSRVFQVLDAIRDIDGYDELCSKSLSGRVDYETGETTCSITSVTQFWNNSFAYFTSSVTSDEEAIAAMSATEYPNNEDVALQNIIGNAELDQGILQFAQSFRMIISLPDDDDTIQDEAKAFEADVADKILDMREEWESEDGNPFRVDFYTESTFSDEFNRAIEEDLFLVPLVFIFMSIFCVIVFSRKDKVRSRGLLGLGAVFSVLLSLFTSYGLMFIIGVPLTSMTQILPFIMFGIGLDDVFVIIGEYERLSHMEDAVERIKETMKSTGVSISLTTITSVLAFASGCASSIPLVYWLCLYAFPTVLCIYLYTITFVIALTVLDERRLQNNRRGCLVCFHGKGGDENQNHRSPTTELPLAEKFMIWYSKKLMQKWVKVGALMAFTALLGGLAYSASQLEVQFNFLDVLPSDSYAVQYVDTSKKYIELSSISPYVFFRFEDQSNTTVQEDMQSYLDQLVEDVDSIEKGPPYFWLRDFHKFVEDTEGMDTLDFTEQLDTFLKDDVYKVQYANDIVRDGDQHILSSRCEVHMSNLDIEDIQNQVDALTQQRSVSKQQTVNQDGDGEWSFFTYSSLYSTWEFYDVVVAELTMSTILGVCMVTLVALVFMPHISGFLFVGPFIAVLYIDLLGVLQWGGIAIGPVSYVGLIMSIGLMVDYIVHIVLRYIESTAPDREGKVMDTLCSMGASVLVGGLSTLLGVLPLILSSTEIFFTIFVIFCGLVVLGMLHGLVLLPVVLSIVGPIGRQGPPIGIEEEEEEVEEWEAEDEGEDELDNPDLVRH